MISNEYTNWAHTELNQIVSGKEDTDVPNFVDLLRAQTRLIFILQKELEAQRDTMSPREMKDLIATIGSHLSLLHRMQEAQQLIATYELLIEEIMIWAKTLDPTLVEQLITHLRAAAASANARMQNDG
jgi:hypothetical protein